MNIVKEPEPLVPVDDVARHFSVSVSTIRKWVSRGLIPRDTFMKLGNTYRFNLSAVVAALTSANRDEVPVEDDMVNIVNEDVITEPDSDDDLSLDDI